MRWVLTAHKRFSSDFILCNANVITLDPVNPRAQLVAASYGRIDWVGEATALPFLLGNDTTVVDCQGMTVIPGFIDAHCHLLGLASRLTGMDCGSNSIDSIDGLVEAIRRYAVDVPVGKWIRAYGYDEVKLRERRHPNRLELDAAAPNHLVRLQHRTGHASVFNSRGLAAVNIGKDTPDPPDGVILRDDVTGEPTGILLEMQTYVRGHLANQKDENERIQGIHSANDMMLSVGVTSIQDAGPNNDHERWIALKKLKETRNFVPRITMMIGADKIIPAMELGLRPGFGNDDLKLGHVKIMLTCTTGALQPTELKLQEIIKMVHENGFDVAVHAVEQEAVDQAVLAISQAQRGYLRSGARHRIEHCSECPIELAEKLYKYSIAVVTQPGFIYQNGDKYLTEVVRNKLPLLYPLRTLSDHRVHVAAGSDAPVTYPNPILGIYAATTRRTASGCVLSSHQTLSVEEGLRMHTLEGAYVSADDGIKGSIKAGKLADLVVLNMDPTKIDPEDIKDVAVVMTIVGGKVVWER